MILSYACLHGFKHGSRRRKAKLIDCRGKGASGELRGLRCVCAFICARTGLRRRQWRRPRGACAGRMFVGPALYTTAYVFRTQRLAARFWHDLRQIELARATNVWAAKYNSEPWEEEGARRSCASDSCHRLGYYSGRAVGGEHARSVTLDGWARATLSRAAEKYYGSSCRVPRVGRRPPYQRGVRAPIFGAAT